MSYELEFLEEALAEWRRLDGSVREQFKPKLAERLNAPRIPSAKLHGHPDRYKIKLRSVGYRLVCRTPAWWCWWWRWASEIATRCTRWRSGGKP